jgi:hypothetical protein
LRNPPFESGLKARQLKDLEFVEKSRGKQRTGNIKNSDFFGITSVVAYEKARYKRAQSEQIILTENKKLCLSQLMNQVIWQTKGECAVSSFRLDRLSKEDGDLYERTDVTFCNKERGRARKSEEERLASKANSLEKRTDQEEGRTTCKSRAHFAR